MAKLNTRYTIMACLLLLIISSTAYAGDVKILSASFQNRDNNQWSVEVTLKHEDTGWEHYADSWRIVDSQGKVLGERILLHPHVNEQPFTRGLDGVKLTKGIRLLYIEAHDKVHGWTPKRLEVDLSQAVDGHLRIKQK